ncbi:MAG: threonine/serine dehydratase [Gemmatimonadaceae bacterium]|nr:threonine/serine dehydratase [Gemmatimonadaceae bacterium]
MSTIDLAVLPAQIRAARERLRDHIRQTPFDLSLPLSERLQGNVRLKGEHLQHTGSFKARGALHKVLCLTPEGRARGVVAASSGNHGAGLAWGCRLVGVRAVIYVPEQASPAKVAMIRRLGAEVRCFGTDGLDTEEHARAVAEREGMTYVSPYNDLEVLCGQGTIGVEMAEQLATGETLDAVIVSVGGGGLIGGVAAALKAAMPTVRVIGALPANSPVMAESVAAGTIVVRASLPTLSDGTAGGIEAGAITFPACQALVDEWVLVSEAEIAAAMRRFVEEHHQLIEGSAGVALAALERIAAVGGTRGLDGQRVAVVLCGANITTETLVDVLRVRPDAG